MTLSSILEWKRYLMDKLNTDVFNPHEWRAFLDAARDGGYQVIAADMQRRFDHYTKTKEQECFTKQSTR